MKKLNNLSRTGIFALLIAVISYFSINGFNLTSDQSSKQLAHNEEKYSEVRIYATTEQDASRMVNAGLIIDHAVRKPGQYIDTWLSENEMLMLQSSGVP